MMVTRDNNSLNRYFELETCDKIVACVADKYKDTVSTLHKNLSVILRVISSTRKVNCQKLEVLINQTTLLIAEKLPWVSLSFTLHGLLHHSVELI